MNIHTNFKILNQNSNSSLLGLDPSIDWLFTLPKSSQAEEQQKLSKKREEQSWREGERWRTIERKRDKRVWSQNLH